MTSRLLHDLEKIIADNTGSLLRGALAMGFAQSDAEELVQDTFVAYLKARDRFAEHSSVRTYLFGILYNKGAELVRKRHKESSIDEIEALFDSHFNAAGHWLSQAPQGPEDAALTAEIARIIAACAEQLTPPQRVSFFLKETEGTSSEDICNSLWISDTNLRVILFRARLRLRECLEKNWPNR